MDIAGILGSARKHDDAQMQTLVTPRLVLEPLVAAHADALYPRDGNASAIGFVQATMTDGLRGHTNGDVG